MLTPGRSASVVLIATSQVLVMALWFSASAVLPALRQEVQLSAAMASLFTSAVQMGFVVGTLVSAILGLADRLDPRRLIGAAALCGALANAAILLTDPGSATVVALRFVTGVTMAGVYPVGIKLVASWARGDMGLLVGLLVGALTLGSASPHLFHALGGVGDGAATTLGGLDWRWTLGAASVSATAGALLIQLAGLGPSLGRAARFDPQAALHGLRERGLRLANLGYLGHMWELYAMWTWIGLFLLQSLSISGDPTRAPVTAALATFAVIGSGAVGSWLGGVLADRIGRTALTIGAMVTSGACALVVGSLFGASPSLLIPVCLVWGVTVIADSAQFSASVAELSRPSRVGTALTMQTCMGFLLTLASIHLVPPLVERIGWRYAFALLAVGPWLGAFAMARLRALPEARQLAGGRR